jgi:hypothetical protein
MFALNDPPSNDTEGCARLVVSLGTAEGDAVADGGTPSAVAVSDGASAILATAASAQVHDTTEGTDASGQVWIPGAGQDFADGENLLASVTGLPATPDSVLAPEPSAPRKTKQQFHQEGLGGLREIVEAFTKSDGDAAAKRIELYVAVATLVSARRFDIEEYCFAASMVCTKATRSNPHAAVFQGAMPNLDKKLTSKWGIGNAYALKEADGLPGLSKYLHEHSMEKCVRNARRAKAAERAARPGPTGTRQLLSRLVISGVPAGLDGRVTVTIAVSNGKARFISQAAAEMVADTPVVCVAPPSGGDMDAPSAETALGDADGSSPSSSRPSAPDIHHGENDATGDFPLAGEAPAAA